MKRAPILDPAFTWHGAATHSDPAAFRERMRQRMAEAQKRTPLTRKLELRQIVGNRSAK